MFCKTRFIKYLVEIHGGSRPQHWHCLTGGGATDLEQKHFCGLVFFPDTSRVVQLLIFQFERVKDD